MWPSQRRGDAPFSLDNARGLRRGNHMGNSYASFLRQKATEHAPTHVGEAQQGAVTGDGAVLPMFICIFARPES